jgi:hypothetical protein
MFVKVKYGILVSYYGMIELDKQGYKHCNRSCWFKRQFTLQQETFKQQLKWMEIGKRWRFWNLTNSIHAINSSITTLKTKFENNDPPTAVTHNKALVELPFRSTFSFSGKYQVQTLCIVKKTSGCEKPPFSIKFLSILFYKSN